MSIETKQRVSVVRPPGTPLDVPSLGELKELVAKSLIEFNPRNRKAPPHIPRHITKEEENRLHRIWQATRDVSRGGGTFPAHSEPAKEKQESGFSGGMFTD